MPTLEWIGKDKVVNHHQQVPYRVLEAQYTHNAERSDNMIIRGDNLEALKSLLPRYEGKVKCIYIDPPYNTAHSTTANQKWKYSDNVDDPKIREWIGKVVGDEGEDLSRHDKWLCMMYPRLKLLQKLLADDGTIFISIDDNELYALKTICDEIFGRQNFVANIAWQKTYSPRNDSKGMPYETDAILVYSKVTPWIPNKLERTAAMEARYKRPDNDPVPWKSGDASAAGAADHQGMVYAIQHPITGRYMYPPQGRHWKDEQETILAIMNRWAKYELKDIDDAVERARICNILPTEVRIGVQAIVLTDSVDLSSKNAKEVYDKGNWPDYYFTSGGKGGIAFKVHAKDDSGRAATNLWPYAEVGHTDEAKKELKAIFGGTAPFETPKPSRLIERILQIACDKNAIILDSFAGSGTTAHAVLNMNKADDGNRKFILIEMMDYAESITAERVKRVIDGYTQDQEIVLFDEEITVSNLEQGAELLAEAKAVAKDAKGKYSSVKKPVIEDNHLKVVAVNKAKDAVPGTGGDFTFYDLGEALLLPNGNLNENVSTDKIREYVYYMETKEALSESGNGNPYFMGASHGAAYYFYYEKEAITTLDYDFLATIPERADGYIIYADLCTIPAEELAKHSITFKKIPRDIARL